MEILFLAIVTYAHSQCVDISGTLDRHRLRLLIIYLSHHENSPT